MMPAMEFPASIHPMAFGLLFTARNSPTSVKTMAPIATVPIPSMGKKNCMNRNSGARRQPKIPKATAKLPISSSFLWLYLTLKKPSIRAKMTETMLEMVTSWPVVAIVTGLEEPKNSVATSIRNMPVRDSIIHVEKKATAKEGTKYLPAEDGSSVFCTVDFFLQIIPNDRRGCSAVSLLCW